ncbi:hypothetical protein Acsp06_07910 [Actinomycetospora sp. NBRC 106375]|uniref:type VII secretion-associated protein n=1 Tax=Actinomycetospora sp. NBRC 106375 TaxID=3032207 RepID=UPI00249FA9D0|nr:type VII secretion-associated protein [Actinomycetospora sp. NBRC 106375]GLZ44606.1 hypothetical protein Acsp06_07910 [Actinomycetospora sp. NBRC 106375]
MSDAPAVAIDLGVTTVAAAVDVAPPVPVAQVDPADLPVDLAAVFAPADGTGLVAGAAARRLAPTDPSRYEPTPRLRVDEPDLLLGTRVVGVAEAWGAVLAGVLARAGPLLRGGRPRHLVLTHPAGWDAGRREVLRRGGSGLAEELTLLPAPVAVAAYAAWMRPASSASPGRSLAVLDLGARGAAAAVLAPAAGRCGGARLLARREDGRFGGDDADELLLGHLLTALSDDPFTTDPEERREADRIREVVAATTLADRRHRQVLLDDVRAAKEQLSDAEQAAVPLPGRTTAAWLSRGELTEVLRPALRGVVDLLADTLADAGAGPEHLDGVWLTGGGARIPLLAALVHRELGVPATVAPEPRLVVAHGALVAAREDEAARRGETVGAASELRAGGAAVAGAALGAAAGAVGETAGTAGWHRPPGPLLDSPTAPLPPVARAAEVTDAEVTDAEITDAEITDAEITEDLGAPGDTPAWLTPTAPGSQALLPVRRVRRADPGAEEDTEVREVDPGSRRLPARRPRPPSPARGRVGVGAVVVALLAVVALVTGVVLGARALRGPAGTPTVVGGQTFVAPLGWVTAGGDAAARRVLLRPQGAPRGTDLVAVQENPLDPAAAADPDRARAQLASQYEAARAAGDPVSGYEPQAELGGRDVARYRQDPAPGVRVDWFVVLSPPSMVSVGCRHGTDDADARRVLAACAQVVETLEPAG